MYRKLPIDRIKSSVSADWTLEPAEAEKLLAVYGANDILEAKKNRLLEIAKDTAKDPMIWFLVGASLLFAILKNYTQTAILLLATIPLIFMDAYLHWRTEASTQSLKGGLANFVKVMRNQLETLIPARDLVPGDLVLVFPNQSFPADGIIVGGQELQVDESSLTGESFPVQKKLITHIHAQIQEPNVDNIHWGYAGTRLLTGQALLRVVFTGKETLYGEIVTSAEQSVQSITPLQKAIARLVLNLILVATLFCLILAGVRLYQGFGFIDALLSAALLAVAALPDEFPVVFTFFLGLGVYRLASKKALVQRGVSVENIGRITCICSDKTGTITEGRFKLTNLLAKGIEDKQLLTLAGIAAREDSGDLLDVSIMQAIEAHTLKIPPRIKTFPFTEDRKRETSIIQFNDQQLKIATKGSPETIFAISTLTESEKADWTKSIHEFAAEGYKIIACAEIVSNDISLQSEPEQGYQFAGLLVFSDPPRKEVFEAVQNCLISGIHVLMITGDHPETARTIAKSIGLGKGNPKVILAEEAESHWKNNDGAFFRTIDAISRAIPIQKLSIVTALQSCGEIVAATGDGVNDVPALKAADVGIAMGERGTQSAREVSDIILLDDNFSSIVNAIAEGRQLFTNLKLSFKYLLLIHMPFVISAALIPLLGFPLVYYPIHIVFIELLIHPTSMLVFQELPASKTLDPLTRDTKLRLFTTRDWFGITLLGLLTTAVIVISNIYILNHSNEEHARAFVIASLGFMSAAFTLGLSGFKTLISRVIILSSLFCTVVLVELHTIAEFTQLTPLSLQEWGIVMMISLVTLVLTLGFKK